MLQGIYSYWCAHFILPKGILNSIRQLLSRYLWNGNSICNNKSKVAWDTVTLPKEEGGLGLKNICDWNKALIIKHLIAIINPSSCSLWGGMGKQNSNQRYIFLDNSEAKIMLLDLEESFDVPGPGKTVYII